ncbi:hypothetical protein AA313_de0210341 [Arthrobotrys entomopaga]|nr:hypothetical protein AA313_de0210341 [Arthrobotrys entomopaga]
MLPRRVLSWLMLSATIVSAQSESLCDKYTTALFKNNTAENQYTLLVKLVNTALIGNYTAGAKVKVNGILVPGMFMGQDVTLLPYFNGGLLSTNRGTASPVNFIDDGGAIPLAEDKPANGNTSNQYKLITHLYEFFGALLQCSKLGQPGFPAYTGDTSMYNVHKYMNLNPIQMGYFIQEVGLSAASFGVAEADILAVASALNGTFNQRCAPPIAVLPNQTALQAICINTACPEASNPVCTSYSTAAQPATATSTPGPQLTDLAPQLSSIAAGNVGSSTVTSMGGTNTSIMSASMTNMPAITESPNAAPMHTVGPALVVLAGAGIVGRMML